MLLSSDQFLAFSSGFFSIHRLNVYLPLAKLLSLLNSRLYFLTCLFSTHT